MIIIHPQTPYSAACLIAWTVGGMLVTQPKGRGYITHIKERNHVPDHQAQTKIVHQTYFHAAPETLGAA